MHPTAAKILIAYATNSGSTAEVARVIGTELEQAPAQVDVQRIQAVGSPDGYTAVVVAAPMIMGWHPAALQFIRRHKTSLARLPVAYAFTAISLTQTNTTLVDGVPVYIDRQLPKPPRHPGRLSWREQYTTAANYLRPVLKQTPAVKPVSVGFFAGRMEFFRLNVFQMLLALLLTAGQAGDFRHWDEIRAWSAALRPRLAP